MELGLPLPRDTPSQSPPLGRGRGAGLCPGSLSSVSPAGQHVLLGLRFQELSWDHTSPEEEESVLWLEFDGDHEGTPVNKLLKIYSKQVVVGVDCSVGGGPRQVLDYPTLRLVRKEPRALPRAWDQGPVLARPGGGGSCSPGWLPSGEGCQSCRFSHCGS